MTEKIFITHMKPLSIQNGDNAAEKWKQWRLRFEIFMDANEIRKYPNEKQTAILLNAIGDEGISIFQSFNVDRNVIKLEDLLHKFDEKFNPHTNVTVERYNFFTRSQKEDESLEDYLTLLNNLASNCNFGQLKDELIKDMLVIGIKNTKIKERLLQEENLTTEIAMKIAKSLELSHERSTKLVNNTSMCHDSVQAVKSTQNTKGRWRPQERDNQYNEYTQRNKSPFKNASRSKSPAYNNNICKRCGQIHKYKCPAEGKTCNICKRKNHFSNFCFFKDKHRRSYQKDN
ncbi:PREDICTED: uncharacterized protein LOC106099688 [Papilio polytes]|uniref:uncharacterized protein LOC106099688 n=1 Tax=Papilio polytes TaxID=76194 RepID=UPI0006761691|nr:PREDICTED: uncharacterized protein LOC106099688 [Papilio polytes]